MKKGILVLVLASVVVAGSDTLLADKGGTLPRITASNQDQTNEADADGKQALRATKDTKDAVREERTSTVFSSCLGDLIRLGLDWITRMEEMKARMKEANARMMEDVASERAVRNDWMLYESKWTARIVAKKQTENDWWKANKAMWKNDEDALVNFKADFDKKKAAWGEKQAARDKKKAKLEEGALERETAAWEQEETAWTKENKFLVEEEKLLTNKVLISKRAAAEKQIEHVLPDFEELHRVGATPKDYQKVVGLKSSIVNQLDLDGATRENIFRYGPEYTKYLYFKVLIEKSSRALHDLPSKLFERS